MSTGPGYGVASVPTRGDVGGSPVGSEPPASPPDEPESATHTSLTADLGSTEMAVDAYAIHAGGTVDLDPGRERVLLPLDDGPVVTLDGRFAIPRDGIARVPPNRPCTVGSDDGATLLVVSVPTAEVDGGEPTIVDLDAVSFELPPTSDVATAHLTGPLSCSGLKVNARVLEGGQRVPYHTEGTQEELFVPLDDATMRIDDEHVDAPRGSVVRVAPETPRSAINDERDRTRWAMFGAPPTGGPTDWDPEAEIVE